MSNTERTLQQLYAVREELIGIITRTTRCCINCDSFNEASEKCQLADPPARPPARIIAFGCDSFVDKVPF